MSLQPLTTLDYYYKSAPCRLFYNTPPYILHPLTFYNSLRLTILYIL